MEFNLLREKTAEKNIHFADQTGLYQTALNDQLHEDVRQKAKVYYRRVFS